MKRFALVALLSTPFLTSCGEPKRVAVALPTPPERLVCEAAGARPSIPAEHIIDWNRVVSVAQAKSEHERYVATIRTREGVVAAYILSIEGKLFVCSNNAQWRRDYEAGLPR
jgi:hypothetical protein